MHHFRAPTRAGREPGRVLVFQPVETGTRPDGRSLMEPRLPTGPELGLEAHAVPLRVLVLQASAYTARVFEDVSALTGLSVDFSRTPRQALRLLQRESYDVVVVELPLPMSPEELYRGIMTLGREQADRVVFLVNDLGDPETRKFLTAAGRPFLTRPVDPMELSDLVLRVGLNENGE